ncbi:hypothetical protein H2248_002907 [Termitomyces sp. 'cryptogamus']|nr:hypothetical protein H2248_002907 [Termitomyces sp. 'cryptogamus']
MQDAGCRMYMCSLFVGFVFVVVVFLVVSVMIFVVFIVVVFVVVVSASPKHTHTQQPSTNELRRTKGGATPRGRQARTHAGGRLLSLLPSPPPRDTYGLSDSEHESWIS